jgi:hypothetical protein
MLKTLNTNCDRYPRSVLLLTGRIHNSARTHRTLSFRTRDAEVARGALRQHFNGCQQAAEEKP